MRHGDFELFESKAIGTYLDRMFPGPRLIPEDPRDAALAEQWISAVNTVIDRTMVRTYLFGYIFPKTADGKPDRKAIDEVTPALREQIDILDKAVAKTGHLAGKQFTLADINLMPILFYVRNFPEGGEAIARGQAPLGLLRAACAAAELQEHDAAPSAAAAGQARRAQGGSRRMNTHQVVSGEQWLAAAQVAARQGEGLHPACAMS